MSTPRTWSGLRITTIVGGFASSRSQISVASSGGASGSSSATWPPDSTQVDVTGGSQPASACQSGCATRQIQRPGATSVTLTLDLVVDHDLPDEPAARVGVAATHGLPRLRAELVARLQIFQAVPEGDPESLVARAVDEADEPPVALDALEALRHLLERRNRLVHPLRGNLQPARTRVHLAPLARGPAGPSGETTTARSFCEDRASSTEGEP